MLPAPKDSSKSVDRFWVRVTWRRAETLAGLKPKRGRGWHSLRWKFASDLMHQPLKVHCELGGWKTVHTVIQCYQRIDEDQLRSAPEGPAEGRGLRLANIVSEHRYTQFA